jgi:myosin heavy subunit
MNKNRASEITILSLSSFVAQYVDNSAIIEVFERKGTGLLPMLDEEILVPRGTDETLLSKIYKTYTNHPLVSRLFVSLHMTLVVNSNATCRGKPSGKDTKFRSLFVLSHYAGEVAYSVNGILDRNKVFYFISFNTHIKYYLHRYTILS